MACLTRLRITRADDAGTGRITHPVTGKPGHIDISPRVVHESGALGAVASLVLKA